MKPMTEHEKSMYSPPPCSACGSRDVRIVWFLRNDGRWIVQDLTCQSTRHPEDRSRAIAEAMG